MGISYSGWQECDHFFFTPQLRNVRLTFASLSWNLASLLDDSDINVMTDIGTDVVIGHASTNTSKRESDGSISFLGEGECSLSVPVIKTINHSTEVNISFPRYTK